MRPADPRLDIADNIYPLGSGVAFVPCNLCLACFLIVSDCFQEFLPNIPEGRLPLCGSVNGIIWVPSGHNIEGRSEAKHVPRSSC